MLLPVFFAFVYFNKPDLGFTSCIVVGMLIIAIRLQWGLRKYGWFWATVLVVLLLHVPLLLMVHWPRSNVPAIAYSLPLGITDFLLISGAIRIAEKLFFKGTLYRRSVEHIRYSFNAHDNLLRHDLHIRRRE